MLFHVRTRVAGFVGVLVLGMLLGNWLAGTDAFWWVVVALGVVAFGGGIILHVIEKSHANTKTETLAEV